MADPRTPFDPITIMKVLDRHRVNYIVIGALARVIHGADEVTAGLDIVPSRRAENVRRLEAAVQELGADLPTVDPNEKALDLETTGGELKVVLEPDGTHGYDDLRRAATREPLGGGVRPAVASVGDLARMLAAHGRQTDLAHLQGLRRIAEIEIGRGVDM